MKCQGSLECDSVSSDPVHVLISPVFRHLNSPWTSFSRHRRHLSPELKQRAKKITLSSSIFIFPGKILKFEAQNRGPLRAFPRTRWTKGAETYCSHHQGNGTSKLEHFDREPKHGCSLVNRPNFALNSPPI